MLTTWDELKEMDIRNTETPVEDESNKNNKQEQPENNNKPKESIKEQIEQQKDNQPVENKINEPDEPEKQVKEKETNNVDFLESFNKKFDTDYKDYDSIGKILKESTSTITSLQDQNKKYKEDISLLEKELEERYEASNPEKIYGGKDGYIKHLIQEKGKQEGYNPSVINRIISHDIDKINPLNLIMMDIENKAEELTGDQETLMALSLKKVGINVDEERRKHEEKRRQILEDEDKDIGLFNIDNINLTKSQIGEIKVLASDIRRKFKEFKKVEPQEFKNYKESKEQKLSDLKKQREEILNEWDDRFNDFNDFKISVKYTDTKGEQNEYDFMDEEYNKNLIDVIKEYVGNNNIKPTRENINNLRLKIENDFWADKSKRDKALKKILEDAKSLTEEKIDNKYENGKPISKEVAPDPEDTDDEIGAWLERRKGKVDLNSIWQ